MNFDFDKFIEDIEKRENSFQEKRKVSENDYFEEDAKRKRKNLYQEKWQNRIKWEK